MEDCEIVLTPAEAAKVLKIGRDKVKAMIASGRLRAVRFGPKLTRVPMSAIRDILARDGNAA